MLRQNILFLLELLHRIDGQLERYMILMISIGNLTEVAQSMGDVTTADKRVD